MERESERLQRVPSGEGTCHRRQRRGPHTPKRNELWKLVLKTEDGERMEWAQAEGTLGWGSPLSRYPLLTRLPHRAPPQSPPPPPGRIVWERSYVYVCAHQEGGHSILCLKRASRVPSPAGESDCAQGLPLLSSVNGPKGS